MVVNKSQEPKANSNDVLLCSFRQEYASDADFLSPKELALLEPRNKYHENDKHGGEGAPILVLTKTESETRDDASQKYDVNCVQDSFERAGPKQQEISTKDASKKSFKLSSLAQAVAGASGSSEDASALKQFKKKFHLPRTPKTLGFFMERNGSDNEAKERQALARTNFKLKKEKCRKPPNLGKVAVSGIEKTITITTKTEAEGRDPTSTAQIVLRPTTPRLQARLQKFLSSKRKPPVKTMDDGKFAKPSEDSLSCDDGPQYPVMVSNMGDIEAMASHHDHSLHMQSSTTTEKSVRVTYQPRGSEQARHEKIVTSSSSKAAAENTTYAKSSQGPKIAQQIQQKAVTFVPAIQECNNQGNDNKSEVAYGSAAKADFRKKKYDDNEDTKATRVLLKKSARELLQVLGKIRETKAEKQESQASSLHLAIKETTGGREKECGSSDKKKQSIDGVSEEYNPELQQSESISKFLLPLLINKKENQKKKQNDNLSPHRNADTKRGIEKPAATMSSLQTALRAHPKKLNTINTDSIATEQPMDLTSLDAKIEKVNEKSTKEILKALNDDKTQTTGIKTTTALKNDDAEARKTSVDHNNMGNTSREVWDSESNQLASSLKAALKDSSSQDKDRRNKARNYFKTKNVITKMTDRNEKKNAMPQNRKNPSKKRSDTLSLNNSAINSKGSSQYTTKSGDPGKKRSDTKSDTKSDTLSLNNSNSKCNGSSQYTATNGDSSTNRNTNANSSHDGTKASSMTRTSPNLSHQGSQRKEKPTTINDKETPLKTKTKMTIAPPNTRSSVPPPGQGQDQYWEDSSIFSQLSSLAVYDDDDTIEVATAPLPSPIDHANQTEIETENDYIQKPTNGPHHSSQSSASPEQQHYQQAEEQREGEAEEQREGVASTSTPQSKSQLAQKWLARKPVTQRMIHPPLPPMYFPPADLYGPHYYNGMSHPHFYPHPPSSYAMYGYPTTQASYNMRAANGDTFLSMRSPPPPPHVKAIMAAPRLPVGAAVPQRWYSDDMQRMGPRRHHYQQQRQQQSQQPVYHYSLPPQFCAQPNGTLPATNQYGRKFSVIPEPVQAIIGYQRNYPTMEERNTHTYMRK